MRGLVWFRRDLRMRDNPALSAACEECDEVVPLFVFDDMLLNSRVFGSACVTFMLGCLRELSQNLKQSGLYLIWRRGDQVEEVRQTVGESGVSRIYWNRDYEPVALDRDRRVQELMSSRNVMVQTFKDHVIFEGDEVCGMAGGPLQRYSASRNRWWAKWHAGPPQVVTTPRAWAGQDKASGEDPLDWPVAEQLGYHTAGDADVAANNGNWQWCASTGTDALRGYRIFNPALQSRKFDPDGTYIRSYVPELGPLPAKLIHEPHLMSLQEQRRLGCMIGTNYPLPIVDHLKARNEYLELGKQAKATHI